MVNSQRNKQLPVFSYSVLSSLAVFEEWASGRIRGGSPITGQTLRKLSHDRLEKEKILAQIRSPK
jgi:hypothetical protein